MNIFYIHKMTMCKSWEPTHRIILILQFSSSLQSVSASFSFSLLEHNFNVLVHSRLCHQCQFGQ